MPPSPRFSPATFSFLRSLARHNNREWFTAHKAQFERDVREPMVRVIESLDESFREFAPDLVASPRVSMFRIHRDTRFTENKSPYKTSVAAVFPHRALLKTSGAALYFDINPKRLLIAGGVYAPASAELRAIRAHIADNLSRFRSLVEAPSFIRATGGLQGEALVRMPRGYPADHPAADYLRLKQVLVWRERPAAVATGPSFYRELLKVFRAAAPLVGFLNEPLTGRTGKNRLA